MFTAGKRLRALRELMGLSRPQFAELVGMTAKRLENIENELQHMHDEDFEKVCGTFPEFSDWIAYEGSIEPQSIAWKVADSAQAAAVYLVERNPVLLERHGIDMQAWRERHREIREALLAAEQAPEAEPAPLEEPPEPRRQRKRKRPRAARATEAHRARNEGKYLYMVYVVRKRCLFRAGERLFGLRGLTGLNRPQFSEVVGMDPKRLENIESGRQRMHDEDFEKVCGTFPEFSDWIAYEGSIEPQSIAWKIAEAAQEAAVYLVERNPELLELHGLDVPAWREKHREILKKLRKRELSPPPEKPLKPRRKRKPRSNLPTPTDGT
ncbi:LOW QUALITY PROTEIN: hypothetical protein PA39016_001330094 [Pseudomonas aeruginosa 39016]|nr:LOW QUALITY PROTEIN: hypothetical protein PA39016_001330094 [Pseudomonas aeruginosa 39016]